MKIDLSLLLLLLILSSSLMAQKASEIKKQELLAKYHHSAPFAVNGLAMVCKGDTEHCGCIDTLGNKVIPFIYGMNFFYFIKEKPQFNSVNRMVVAKPLSTTQAIYGIIDDKGHTILPFRYHIDYHNFYPLDPYHIFYFQADREAPKKYGVIDSLGNILIPFEYDKIEKAGERNFILKKNEWYALANGAGELILDFNYENARYNPVVNRIYVTKETLWGAYTIEGKEILPVRYDGITNSNYSHLIAAKDSLLYFYDLKGNLLKQGHFELDDLKYFTHYIPIQFPLVLSKKGKYGILNARLETTTPFTYDRISVVGNYLYPSNSSLFLAKKENVYGFITANDESKAGVIFTKINPLGIAEQSGKYGWLNNEAELIISCMYDGITAIISGTDDHNGGHYGSLYLLAKKNDTRILFNDQAETISALEILDSLHSIYTQNDKTYLIGEKNGKLGAVSADSHIIVPFEYDSVASDFNLFMRFKFGHHLFRKAKKGFVVDWDKSKVLETSDF